MTIAQQVVIVAAALAFGAVAVWLHLIPKEARGTPAVILMNTGTCICGLIAFMALMVVYG